MRGASDSAGAARADAITVLLPTFNGARYLAAQLHSLAAQTLAPARLILSDDGSRDATVQIATGFARQAPFPVQILHGPGRGLSANLRALLRRVGDGPVALADQDDVWLPTRLAHGAAALAGLPRGLPAIAAGARIVTDAHLAPQRIMRHPQTPGFAAALLQNPAAGNSVLMNAAATALVCRAAQDTPDLPPFQDWWLSQIVLGAGGRVILDPRPGLFYRQHRAAAFGAGIGLRGRAARARLVLDGTYGRWLGQNIRVLHASADRLTPPHRQVLAQFDADLAAGRFRPGQHGIARADIPGDLALRIAARLGCLTPSHPGPRGR